MTVEGAFSTAITTDDAIKALMVDANGNERPADQWWFASSALGIGDNPERPDPLYVVWNELSSSPFKEVAETSNAQWRVFQFYVYDKEGDFTRITNALKEIRRVVKAMAHFTAEDGTRVSAIEWDGISGNITDQGYRENVRFGTARFMSSQ